jgi:hypothetical protein
MRDPRRTLRNGKGIIMRQLLLLCVLTSLLMGCTQYAQKYEVFDTDGDYYVGTATGTAGDIGGRGMSPPTAGAGLQRIAAAPPASIVPIRADKMPEPTPTMAEIEPRKVVYTAGLQIATAEPEKCVDKVKALAETRGGYMQRMSRETISIRVPSEVFEDVLAELEQLGVLISKNVDAQDVTEQFIDLELRLKNGQALLAKLEELLAKTDEVKHALAVEKEISRVRTNVERLQGQLNRMRNQIAYATLTVVFVQGGDVPDHVRARLPFYWLSQLGLYRLTNY